MTQTIDPFLLPVCSHCGGPTSLSHLEPNPAHDGEDLRTFRCAWCGALCTHAVARDRAPKSAAARKNIARR